MAESSEPQQEQESKRPPPIKEELASIKNIISTVKKRNFNLDQEVYVGSPSPLILFNDVSSHHVSPKFTSRLPPLLFRKTENLIQIASAEQNKKEDQAEPKDEESDDGESVSIGSSKESKKTGEIDIFKTKEEDIERKRCEKLEKILNNKYYQAIIFVATLYALFGIDIKSAVTTKAADIPFDVLTIIVMTLFVSEILLSILTQPGYFFSFFFWLDTISTASLVFDISLFVTSISGSGAAKSIKIARASRATRIGTRAGRIVRVVRLIRLVRLVKIYKQAQVTETQLEERRKLEALNALKTLDIKRRASLARITPLSSAAQIDTQTPLDMGTLPTTTSPRMERTLPTTISPRMERRQSVFVERRKSIFVEPILADSSLGTSTAPETHPQEIETKESRVGKKLSDLTTKRVISIVLLLLFIVPLLSTDYYFDADQPNDLAADYLRDLIVAGASQTEFENAWKVTVDTLTQDNVTKPLIYMYAPTRSEVFQTVDPSTLRDVEMDEASADFSDTTLNYDPVKVVIDLRGHNTFEALLSIGRTVFVCIVLTLGALMFSRDVNIIALAPLERMIHKVNKLAQDPLSSKDEKLIQDSKEEQNEIVQIENAISKIGTLLALGFGEAGAAIIAQNMAADGDVNPMIRGQKKVAIFGFCDIRNFTDATEVLQEEVMVFVNSIGDIVHRIVDKFGGAANKNIGDAFLLVWKFSEDDIKYDVEGNVSLYHNRNVQNMCDLAVISFLKIYARINKDPVLLAYRKHPKLLARIPNYQVKMGFGLHVGWAIEGAIGSEFKIDASYLSPNVNMASRLEAATKQYGVPFLISGAIYEHCSPIVKQKMRHIDRVTVKGSKQPVDFYTIDCDLSELPPCYPQKDLTKQDIKHRRKMTKRNIKARIINGGSRAYTLFETDKDLYAMTKEDNETFNDLFKAGFKGYLDGDWSLSKRKFEECLNLKPDDGPTNTLYEVLKENDFIAPEEWKGYRVLTEK